MKSGRIELVSAYPPAECVARLEAAIDVERPVQFGSTAGAKAVVGRVSGTTLNLRKRIDYRNSFQSVLTAELHPYGDGTLILGDCGMNPFVSVFMVGWTSGVLLIGGPAAVWTLLSPHPFADDHWMGIALPVGMLLFGYLLWRFGRLLARQEARFLTDFLTATLEARENDRDAG